MIGKGHELTVEDLGIVSKNGSETVKPAEGEIVFPPFPPSGLDLTEVLNSLEKYYIDEAVRLTGGNESQAAKLLNINHHTFRYRRKKLDEN